MGGAPFHVGNSDFRGTTDAQPWSELLRCDHSGEGRIAHTPMLIQAERVDGQPRQQLLRRLPIIRSCCLASDPHRAAWWLAVDSTLADWMDDEAAHPSLSDPELATIRLLMARDWPALMPRLRQVVPRPSRAATGAIARRAAEIAAENDRLNREYAASLRSSPFRSDPRNINHDFD